MIGFVTWPPLLIMIDDMICRLINKINKYGQYLYDKFQWKIISLPKRRENWLKVTSKTAVIWQWICCDLLLERL